MPHNANEHVVEYLDYYCSEDTLVDYAVLIKGEWGSGKTHIIERFFEQWKAQKIDRQYLRVSLYGITSFRQIEEDFYRQMHPVLSSKGAKLLGKVGKGILKTTLKIDLDGDGRDDATLNSQIPEIDPVDYFGQSQGTILIFDDLERCEAIDTSTILGYINGYVENSGFKAIIVADESKILSRKSEEEASKDKKYSTIKEKLIGQTLMVSSDIDSALPTFLKNITDHKAKNLLESISDDIKLIFGQSKTNNLRLLKRSVWLLERLAKQLDEKHWNIAEGVTSFFKVFLALGLESGAGRIGADDLAGFSESPYSIYLQRKEQKLSPAAQARDRYPTVDFNAFPLDVDFLRNVLFSGIVHKDQIHAALANSSIYADPVTEPAWKTAWREFEVTDDEFEKAVSAVEADFATRTDWVAGELLHVLGLRLRFARIGVIQKTQDDVVAENNARIDQLTDLEKLPHFEDDGFGRRSGWGGFGFSENSTPHFDSVYKYYVERLADMRAKRYPKEAQKLLEIMTTDVAKFFRALCANNVEASPYYDVPILSYLEPKNFAEKLLGISGMNQVNVMSTLKERYSHKGFSGQLGPEREWIESVVEVLQKAIPAMRPASKDRMTTLISRDLEPLIARSSD